MSAPAPAGFDPAKTIEPEDGIARLVGAVDIGGEPVPLNRVKRFNVSEGWADIYESDRTLATARHHGAIHVHWRAEPLHVKMTTAHAATGTLIIVASHAAAYAAGASRSSPDMRHFEDPSVRFWPLDGGGAMSLAGLHFRLVIVATGRRPHGAMTQAKIAEIRSHIQRPGTTWIEV